MASLKARAQFYTTMATMEEAGVPRVRALQTGMPYGFAGPAKRMARALQVEGITLHEAMGQLPRLFSRFEGNMVAVGEATGRMDTVCRSLSSWFEFVRAIRTKVISGLLYPLVVYHLAAVMLPFISTITEKLTPEQAIRQGLLIMAAPWVLFVLWQMFGSALLALPGVSPVLLATPLLGGVIYRLDCARFFQAYAMGINSGLGSFETVDLGARACKNPAMRNRFLRIGKAMRSEGMTFTQAFLDRATYRDMSSPVPSMMKTGEETGRNADMAERIARVAREEAEATIERAAKIIPTLLYLCLAIYIGYQIISLYQKILINPIRELTE
jgi:type II secretory pathway component PulF